MLGHILYRKSGGHKIVCTGVKFKSWFNVIKNHTNRFLLLKQFRKKYSSTFNYNIPFCSYWRKGQRSNLWLYRGQTGQNAPILLEWSQNARLANTIQIQNNITKSFYTKSRICTSREIHPSVHEQPISDAFTATHGLFTMCTHTPARLWMLLHAEAGGLKKMLRNPLDFMLNSIKKAMILSKKRIRIPSRQRKHHWSGEKTKYLT